jgi:small subunit ribosomal protein S1
MHTAQMEKFAAAEAAGHGGDQSPGNGAPPEKAGGSLASDAQLAALREKLAGNA